jgi:predicted transcriptional regulator of viral defense system
MSATEISVALGIEATDLRKLLAGLADKGCIERTGRGRGTRYKLAEGGEA